MNLSLLAGCFLVGERLLENFQGFVFEAARSFVGLYTIVFDPADPPAYERRDDMLVQSLPVLSARAGEGFMLKMLRLLWTKMTAGGYGPDAVDVKLSTKSMRTQ